MPPALRDEPFNRTIYGFSTSVPDGAYSAAGAALMDKLWAEIRARNLAHRGRNHWFYGPQGLLFTGVELQSAPLAESDLQRKDISFGRHLWAKHVGPVQAIEQTYASMRHALTRLLLKPTRASLEVYGHWVEDESLYETEILIEVA